MGYGLPALNDELEVYELEEQVIGTWLGKVLYRKVLDFGAMPSNSEKTVAHSIVNLNIFRSIQGICFGNTGVFLTLPHVDPSNLASAINVYSVAGGLLIGVKTAADRAPYTHCYITLEYTKTID